MRNRMHHTQTQQCHTHVDLQVIDHIFVYLGSDLDLMYRSQSWCSKMCAVCFCWPVFFSHGAVFRAICGVTLFRRATWS